MSTARPHWWPAYVGIGSNLDDPRRQVRSAFEALARVSNSRLVGSSRLYSSPPMDASEQPDYLNAVASLLTQHDAVTFLHELQAIEQQHGRQRTSVRWAPRTLDLDQLVFGDLEICNDELSVPHPGIGSRAFVLIPLCDIAPHLQVPGMGSVQQLLRRLPDPTSMLSMVDD
jgi:2-amino-4-hydroxy-6-hydroxymethyldihydropteridine diphosphokinase